MPDILPPPGFVLASTPATPAPPAGFVLDHAPTPTPTPVPPPHGFVDASALTPDQLRSPVNGGMPLHAQLAANELNARRFHGETITPDVQEKTFRDNELKAGVDSQAAYRATQPTVDPIANAQSFWADQFAGLSGPNSLTTETALSPDKGPEWVRAAVGGATDAVAGKIGVVAPTYANELRTGNSVANSFDQSHWYNRMARTLGAFAPDAPLLLLGGPGALAASGGASGVGAARMEAAEARAAGQEVSGTQELGGALLRGGIGAAVGYGQGKLMQGAGALAGPFLPASAGALGKFAGAAAADIAGNVVMNPITQIANNAVSPLTRPFAEGESYGKRLGEGVPESLEEGLYQGVAFALMAGKHAVNRGRVERVAQEIGTSDVAIAERPSSADGYAAHELAMASTGAPPVWFESTSPRVAKLVNEGTAESPSLRLYLNASHPGEAGEEAFHALWRDPAIRPELEAFAREHPDLVDLSADNYAARAEAKGEHELAATVGEPGDRRTDEGLANLGKAVMTPEVIQMIAQKNPGLLARMFQRVQGMLDTVRGQKNNGPARAKLVARRYAQFIDPLRANVETARAQAEGERGQRWNKEFDAEERTLDAIDPQLTEAARQTRFSREFEQDEKLIDYDERQREIASGEAAIDAWKKQMPPASLPEPVNQQQHDPNDLAAAMRELAAELRARKAGESISPSTPPSAPDRTQAPQTNPPAQELGAEESATQATPPAAGAGKVYDEGRDDPVASFSRPADPNRPRPGPVDRPLAEHFNARNKMPWRIPSDAEIEQAIATGKTQKVKLSHIEVMGKADEPGAMQDDYNQAIAEHYRDHPSDKPPVLIREANGRLFGLEGWHRMTGAKLRGDKSVDAIVIDANRGESLASAQRNTAPESEAVLNGNKETAAAGGAMPVIEPAPQTPANDQATAKPDNSKPSRRPVKRNSRPFTKTDVERRLLQRYDELHPGGDYRSAEDQQNAGTDMIGAAKFTFFGRLPDEVRTFLQGRPEARSLFQVTHNRAEAKGMDAMHALQDRYWTMAEEIAEGKGSRVEKAAAFFEKYPDDPEMQLLSAIHKNMPAAKDRTAKEIIDPSKKAVGTVFELEGERFEIVEDEDGHRLLKDGTEYPVVPADAIEKMPADKGSVRFEEPEVPDFGPPEEPESPKPRPKFFDPDAEGIKSDAPQSGIFGQTVMDGISGQQAGMFAEPAKPAPIAESREDARIRAKFKDGEAATGKLFEATVGEPKVKNGMTLIEVQANGQSLTVRQQSKGSKKWAVIQEETKRDGTPRKKMIAGGLTKDEAIEHAKSTLGAGDAPESLGDMPADDLPFSIGSAKPEDDEGRPTAEHVTADLRRRLADPAAADAAYDALPDSIGGKVLNGDTARHISPWYHNRENATAFTQATHPPASEYIQERFMRELDKGANQGKRLVMLAGGAASGKSSALKTAAKPVFDNADLVLDSNMAGLNAAKQRIQAALDRGWNVTVTYVYRPYDSAVKGMLERAMRNGRYIPLGDAPASMARLHHGAADTFRSLMADPSIGPRIDAWLVDNSGAEGTARIIPASEVAGLLGKDYDSVDVLRRNEPRLLKEVQHRLEPGLLSMLTGAQGRVEENRSGAGGRTEQPPPGRANLASFQDELNPPKTDGPFSVGSGPDPADAEPRESFARRIVNRAHELAGNFHRYVTIDPVPNLAKAGAADSAVDHASAKIAVPFMVEDMIGKIFPKHFDKPEVVNQLADVIVKNRILGGYDKFARLAGESQAESDAANDAPQRRMFSDPRAEMDDLKAKAQRYEEAMAAAKAAPEAEQAAAQQAARPLRLTHAENLRLKAATMAWKRDAIAKSHDLPAYNAAVLKAMQDPAIGPAIKAYQKEIHPQLGEWFAELKGANEGEYEPPVQGRHFDAYAPLLPEIEGDEAAHATRPTEFVQANNVRNPGVKKDPFDKVASYAGQYGKDLNQMLTAVVGPRWNEVTKLRMYKDLIAKGVAVPAGDGSPKPDNIQGQPVAALDVMSMPRFDPETGRTTHPGRRLWIRNDLVKEVRAALETDVKPDQNPIAQALTTVQMMSITDAVAHGKNMLTQVLWRPGRGSSLFDVIAGNPLVGIPHALYTLHKTFKEIHAGGPEIRSEMAEMAKAGLIRPEYDHSGLMAKIGDMTGWEWFKSLSTGKLLHEMDTMGRMILNRRYSELVKQNRAPDTAEGRRAFVLRLGNYNSRLQGETMRFMKAKGLSPFIVAGRNYLRSSVETLTGAPGFKGGTKQQRINARLVQLGTLLSMGLVPAIVNMMTTGTPTGRDGTPLGAVDLGGDPDETGKHAVFDLMQLTGVRRGLRSTGLNATFAGLADGKGINTIAGEAIQDAVSAQMHPWIGPAPSFAFKSLTGRQLDIRGKMEAQTIPEGGAKQYLENLRAALESQNPLMYALTRPLFQGAGLDQKAEGEEKGYAGHLGSTLAKIPAQAAGFKSVRPGMNEAEATAERLAKQRFAGTSMTPEDSAKFEIKKGLMGQLRKNPDEGKAAIAAAVDADQISDHEAASLLAKAGMSSFEWNVRSLSSDDAARVYASSTDEQKETIGRKVAEKIFHAKDLTRDQQDKLLDQIGLEPPADLRFEREVRALDRKARDYKEAAQALSVRKPGTDRQAMLKQMRESKLSPREQQRLDRLRSFQKQIAGVKKQAKEGAIKDEVAERKILKIAALGSRG